MYDFTSNYKTLRGRRVSVGKAKASPQWFRKVARPTRHWSCRKIKRALLFVGVTGQKIIARSILVCYCHIACNLSELRYKSQSGKSAGRAAGTSFEVCFMLRALLFLLCFVFCLPCPAFSAAIPPLKLHVWVGYMPAWLLEDFTKETGIPVAVTFFAENRELLRKLREEGDIQRFDLVTPSSEAVQQLAAEKLLQPLSPEKIPNLGLVDPWFGGLEYDKGFRFSVPLFWGGLGIVIDKRVVPEDVAARIFGYGDLWMPELKGQLLLPNDFRSLMSIMLLSRGYSVNDDDPAHLDAAMSALESLAPSVRDAVSSSKCNTQSLGIGVF